MKNALDDSARLYLNSQTGFEEDHILMNGRLLLSTIAIFFSGYALLDDWLHPFPESKTTLIFCVIAYFMMILLLTLYTTYIEKGCFAAAKSITADNEKHSWKIYSKQKR